MLPAVKERGPVITALMASGRVGAGIGAELGCMRVTEQIDAMFDHVAVADRLSGRAVARKR